VGTCIVWCKHVDSYLIHGCLNCVVDVKPSNTLVNTVGNVKLCDFGVSVQVSWLSKTAENITTAWVHSATAFLASLQMISSVQPILKSMRCLRSASSLALGVCHTRLSTFPVTAACSWNSLPQHVTSTPSMCVFRDCLKAFLFRRTFQWLSPHLL